MNEKRVSNINLKIIMIIFILGIVIQILVPIKLISDRGNIIFTRVELQGSQVSIDENELINILSKYKLRRTFQSFFPYQADKIDIEISFINNHKPKHILLGEFNILYSTTDKGKYKILNAQELKDELNSLIEEKTGTKP